MTPGSNPIFQSPTEVFITTYFGEGTKSPPTLSWRQVVEQLPNVTKIHKIYAYHIANHRSLQFLNRVHEFNDLRARTSVAEQLRKLRMVTDSDHEVGKNSEQVTDASRDLLLDVTQRVLGHYSPTLCPVSWTIETVAGKYKLLRIRSWELKDSNHCRGSVRSFPESLKGQHLVVDVNKPWRSIPSSWVIFSKTQRQRSCSLKTHGRTLSKVDCQIASLKG